MSSNTVALLGWSLPAIESIQKTGRPFVVVSFSDFESYAAEHDIPFVAWNYNDWSAETCTGRGSGD